MATSPTNCFVCGKSLSDWSIPCSECKAPCCSENCQARHYRRKHMPAKVGKTLILLIVFVPAVLLAAFLIITAIGK